MAIQVVSWNVAKRHAPWRELVGMDADVAPLQAVGNYPTDVADKVDTGPPESWDSHYWNSDWWHGRSPQLFDRRAKIVKLSDRVDVEWFRQVSPIGWCADDEMAVSGIGTIAASRVTPTSVEPFVVVLSANLAARVRTVFDRMDALGLEFLGPQAPDGGRQAGPTPFWLPAEVPPPNSGGLVSCCWLVRSRWGCSRMARASRSWRRGVGRHPVSETATDAMRPGLASMQAPRPLRAEISSADRRARLAVRFLRPGRFGATTGPHCRRPRVSARPARGLPTAVQPRSRSMDTGS